MKKGKTNHIWPAYVDMMTVLLLVYVLVSLLFALMIKENIEAQYKEKLDNLMSMSAEEIAENKKQLEMSALVSKNNAQMKHDNEKQNDQDNNLVLAKDAEGKDTQEGEKSTGQSLQTAPQEEDAVSDDNLDMLDHRASDFTLALSENQELLSSEDKKKLNQWYKENLTQIEKNGIDIGVIINKNETMSLGAVYRKQYMLYMDVLRLLVNGNQHFEPSNYSHRSPKPSSSIKNEYLLFRIKSEKQNEK